MHINEFRPFILKIFRLTEQLLSVLFWVLIIYGFDEPYAASLTLIAAVAHECGHEGYLFISGSGGKRLSGRLSGFLISKPRERGYREEIMLYISGPLANLLLAALFFLLISPLGDYARVGAFINLATGLSNLAPLPGYDGHGIIRTLLDAHGAPAILYKLLSALSFFISATAAFIALYLLLRVGDGYWIYGIFISGTLAQIADGLKKAKFEDL